MPAIGNIAINDGKATPVSHVFAPVTTDGSDAELANRSASIPQGYEGLRVVVRKPASATGAYRIDITMTLPTVGTANGLDTVIRTQKAQVTLFCSQLGTAAERKDLRVLLANLFQSSAITSVIENLEPLY